MKLRGSLLGALCIIAVIGPSFGAAAPRQYRAKSSVIVGDGFDYLTFAGQPDKHGLIVAFGVPSGAIFDWPFAVYNASDKPLQNVRLKVYEELDGKREVFDDNAWVYPLTIEPGEFGFGGASLERDGMHFTAGPVNGIDAKLTGVYLGRPKNAKDVVDLTLSDTEIDASGWLTGRVHNPTKSDVKSIEIHAACIEDSGILTQYDWQMMDRRLLRAGTSADVDVLVGPCDGGYFATAIAQYADAP